jgi:hypothetical protein
VHVRRLRPEADAIDPGFVFSQVIENALLGHGSKMHPIEVASPSLASREWISRVRGPVHSWLLISFDPRDEETGQIARAPNPSRIRAVSEIANVSVQVMRQISSKEPIILGGLDGDGGGGDGFAQGLDEGGLLPSDDFVKAVGGVDGREVNSDDEVEEGARLATMGDDSYEELVRTCMQVPSEMD